MAQQPAHVVPRELREPRVSVGVVEERLPVLPQRLVGVHPRAVVAEDRLRHERGDLAVRARHVPHDVLVPLVEVRAARERIEAGRDLALAGGRHLVVADFGGDAHRVHRLVHLPAQVGLRVEGGGGRVALLGRDFVAEVRALVTPAVPVRLDGVHVVERRVLGLLVAHVVEDEELGLGAEVRLVGDARGAQVLLRLVADVPRVARVRRARDRVRDLADHRQRRDVAGGGRVVDRRVQVRHQQHVGVLDLLEAAQRGSVEAQPLLHKLRGEAVRGDRELLPAAEQVGDAELHAAHAARLHQLLDLVVAHARSLSRPGGRRRTSSPRRRAGLSPGNREPVDDREPRFPARYPAVTGMFPARTLQTRLPRGRAQASMKR